MFEKIDGMLRIYCDYTSRSIRVQEAKIIAPGFRPVWGDVATITSSAEWYASEYAKRVVSDDTFSGISWFWHDIQEENDTPPTENPSL